MFLRWIASTIRTLVSGAKKRSKKVSSSGMGRKREESFELTTSSDDDGKRRQSVDLILGESIELHSRHNGSLGGLGVEDTDREGNGGGGGGVISSEHSNSETSLLTLEDGTTGLRSRRIAEVGIEERADQYLDGRECWKM